MIENRNCHPRFLRGKQTQARWMDGYVPPSCVEYGGASESWLSWKLGEAAGKGTWEAYGDICRLYMLHSFRKKIHCTLGPHIFLYICYTSLLRTQLKQNRTKHLAGKQNPNQGHLTRNSTPGCFPGTAAWRGDRASGAGDIQRPAARFARVWLLGIISSDSLAPPMASQVGS